MSTLSKENPIVFQNKNVTVFKNGDWACEKCRRDARIRGITSPNIMKRHQRCMFENEFGTPHKKRLDDDPGFRTFANLGSSPPPPQQPPPPSYGPDIVDPAEAVSATCSLFGTCLSALAGVGGTRKYIKSKRRKTKRKKMKKRKTNRRKMKRRKNKNTKVQKRAR